MKLSIFQLDSSGDKQLKITFDHPYIGYSYPVFLFHPERFGSVHEVAGCYHLQPGDIAELEKV